MHENIQKFDHKVTAEAPDVHLCLPLVTFPHWQHDTTKKMHSDTFAPLVSFPRQHLYFNTRTSLSGILYFYICYLKLPFWHHWVTFLLFWYYGLILNLSFQVIQHKMQIKTLFQRILTEIHGFIFKHTSAQEQNTWKSEFRPNSKTSKPVSWLLWFYIFAWLQ